MIRNRKSHNRYHANDVEINKLTTSMHHTLSHLTLLYELLLGLPEQKEERNCHHQPPANTQKQQVHLIHRVSSSLSGLGNAILQLLGKSVICINPSSIIYVLLLCTIDQNGSYIGRYKCIQVEVCTIVYKWRWVLLFIGGVRYYCIQVEIGSVVYRWRQVQLYIGRGIAIDHKFWRTIEGERLIQTDLTCPAKTGFHFFGFPSCRYRFYQEHLLPAYLGRYITYTFVLHDNFSSQAGRQQLETKLQNCFATQTFILLQYTQKVSTLSN